MVPRFKLFQISSIVANIGYDVFYKVIWIQKMYDKGTVLNINLVLFVCWRLHVSPVEFLSLPSPFCVKGVVLHLLTTIAIPPHRLQPDQLMKIPKLILFDQVRFSGLNNSK